MRRVGRRCAGLGLRRLVRPFRSAPQFGCRCYVSRPAAPSHGTRVARTGLFCWLRLRVYAQLTRARSRLRNSVLHTDPGRSYSICLVGRFHPGTDCSLVRITWRLTLSPLRLRTQPKHRFDCPMRKWFTHPLGIGLIRAIARVTGCDRKRRNSSLSVRSSFRPLTVCRLDFAAWSLTAGLKLTKYSPGNSPIAGDPTLFMKTDRTCEDALVSFKLLIIRGLSGV